MQDFRNVAEFEVGTLLQTLCVQAEYGLSERVAQVLTGLVDAQVCLKAGVNRTHWVHAQFHAPWIIKSYRLLRLEREKLVRTDQSNYGMLMKVPGECEQKGKFA